MVEESAYDCLNFNWDSTYGHVHFSKRAGGSSQGVTLDQARNILLEDVNYFGTCMVAAGDADGMVSGAVHTTANTVRPALQIIKVNDILLGFSFWLLAHSSLE